MITISTGFQIATEKDAELLYDIFVRASLASHNHYTDTEIQTMIDHYSIAEIREEIASKKYTFIIVMRDQNNLGFGAYGKDDDDILFIYKLFIDPEYTGKGVGSALLQYLEDILQSNNQSSSRLYSRLNAVSFYKKHDYHIVDDYIWNIENKKLIFKRMEKSFLIS